MLALGITLVIGVATGVAGNAVYQWTRLLYARWTDHVELVGYWGERMSDGGEHPYSLGSIRYEWFRALWVFDGTNFYGDGSVFCHWKTTWSRYDRKEKRFYYIFLNTHPDSMNTGYTGFGFVDLVSTDGVWRPGQGAFAAGNPGEAFRSHSMVRLESLPINRAARAEVFRSMLDEDGS